MNLSKYTTQELYQLKKDVDKELKSRRRDDAKKAQKEMKAVAEKYGFNLNELMGSQSQRGGRSAAQVRYQHPQDSSKTWSGRGRKPVWIKEWEATGRPLDELKV